MIITKYRDHDWQTLFVGNGSRNFVTGSLNAELFHAAAEGIRVKTEQAGGAVGAVNRPAGLCEYVEDVAALDLFKR